MIPNGWRQLRAGQALEPHEKERRDDHRGKPRTADENQPEQDDITGVGGAHGVRLTADARGA
jgi:hypothetical protein